MDFQTICIHGNKKNYDNTGALCVPIFQSATFAHPCVGESTGYDYSRSQNPTREHLENTVAALEGGAQAIAFSSGMAAVAALMEIFSPGDHLIISDDLYGGTHRLFQHISVKNGIQFTAAETLDAIEVAIQPNTKAIFIETPTNPMMQVTDLAAVSNLAKQHDLLVIVDNTFLTPYFQKPIALGADVVLHSATKYLGGHNDTLAGVLVLKDDILARKIRFIAMTTGACLSPFDSFLISRGVKTLAVRVERQQETALKIVAWLLDNPKVQTVHYPGIQTHPGYAISLRQSTGFGGMISFSVQNEPTAIRILEHVSVFHYAESLGGVESLITYPLMQTHADIPEEERQRRGIDGTLLRISVGLESAIDLIEDLEQAFSAQEK